MSKEKIPATVRNAVWVTYNGKVLQTNCWCCGVEPITKGNFECGHIVSEKNGGKVNLDNLRPICGLCNKSMGIKNMNDFMEKYGLNNYNPDPNLGASSKENILSKKNLREILSSLDTKTIYFMCNVFKLYDWGSKEERIEKLCKKIHRDEINYVNSNSDKKYYIECRGELSKSFFYPNTSNNDINVPNCDKENESTLVTPHEFYTNNLNFIKNYHYDMNFPMPMLIGGSFFRGNIMCKKCKKNRTMKIYKNGLYGIQIDIRFCIQ